MLCSSSPAPAQRWCMCFSREVVLCPGGSAKHFQRECPLWGGGREAQGLSHPGQALELGCSLPDRRSPVSQGSCYSLESRLPGRPLTRLVPQSCGEPSCSEHLPTHLWASPGRHSGLGQERGTVPAWGTTPCPPLEP